MDIHKNVSWENCLSELRDLEAFYFALNNGTGFEMEKILSVFNLVNSSLVNNNTNSNF